MRSQRKSKKQEVDIADLYALKAKALWQSLRKEHISFWLLCTYFFFEYVRPQSIYPALDVLPWAQVFMVATLVTVFTNKSVHWVRNTENNLFIMFCLVVALSGMLAFRPSVAWEYRNVMLGWLVVYFLLISIVNSERRMILFLLVYFLFSFKMAQHGALGWAQRGFSFASWGLVGAPGWFRNSGEYAIQMLIFGSLAISFVIPLKDHWGRYKKWFMYVAAASGYMAIMGASSRGAQIALAVMGIWILLKQKGGFKGLLAIIAIAMLLFFILPDKQIERFTEMGEDANSLQRLAYWKYGLTEVIPRHPLLGVGYHNWVSYLMYRVPEGLGPMDIIQESHNIYIQATAELGVVGLIFFLALVIYAFVNNTRTRRMAKELDNKLLFSLSYGLDAGLIGFLVAGSFVTVLYYPFFWVQVAMIVMLNNVTKNTVRQKENETLTQPTGKGAL